MLSDWVRTKLKAVDLVVRERSKSQTGNPKNLQPKSQWVMGRLAEQNVKCARRNSPGVFTYISPPMGWREFSLRVAGVEV